MKREITTGDMMHVYGCFGAGADYTVRITIRLTENIDPAALRKAVDAAALRYPHFCVRLTKGAENFYYEDNPLPIVILPTEERICLNTPEVNHHVWAVCFAGDQIYLNFFHGITDGTGMYSILATLLYYYRRERYGITGPGGIPTVDIPADEAELTDPQDKLLQTEHMPGEIPPMEQAFTLEKDGGLTPSEATLWDIMIPEEAFIRFTSANDASPGTMISLLLARAIDSLYPERTKKIISAYVINIRPMLGPEKTYHNCLGMAMFPYTEKLKALPFSHQCTVYRGMTFLQSDADRIVPAITENAYHVKQAALAAATVEDKKRVFGQMFLAGEGTITFLVSYIGRWRYPAVADIMRELWVHPASTFSLMAEINAVGGSICLGLQQRFREDSVQEAFLRQLEENSIPYRIVRKTRSDNPAFPEPQ